MRFLFAACAFFLIIPFAVSAQSLEGGLRDIVRGFLPAPAPAPSPSPTPTPTPTPSPEPRGEVLGVTFEFAPPLMKIPEPERGVRAMISFDFDGTKASYNAGLPLLEAAHMRATIFPLPNFFDEPRSMSETDVRYASARGHEIGVSGMSGRDLSLLAPRDAYREITRARDVLENLIGTSTQSFAYPFGGWSELLRRMVIDEGFSTARGFDEGTIEMSVDPFVLPSWNLDSLMTFERAKVIIDQAQKYDQWLIFRIHTVDNSGNSGSLSPLMLAGIINYIREIGVPVVTNAEGAAIMRSDASD